MVLGHKQREGYPALSDAEYTRLYHEKMNASWRSRQDRPIWLNAIEMTEPVAIGCFCPAGVFCHRHLLKDIFEKLCQARGIEFRYYGELTDE